MYPQRCIGSHSPGRVIRVSHCTSLNCSSSLSRILSVICWLSQPLFSYRWNQDGANQIASVSESDATETTTDHTGSQNGEKTKTGSSEDVDNQNQTQKHSRHIEQSHTHGRSGRQFVIILYFALTGAAGMAGYLTGYFVDGLSAPAFLFIIPFPPTPVGFAAYGGLTIAIVIGIPLGLVIYVSEYADSIET